MTPRLHFHGAAGCVTGSCARIETDRANILVDCGLFQGPKTLKALNYQPFPFDAQTIDAVLLTHAHVDHSGLLPKLRLAGFDGPIFSTSGTRALCSVMLPDAGAIQEMEVETLNRRNRRIAREPVTPIYTAEDAEAVMAQFRTIPLDAWTEVAPGVRARFWHAGHIVGSASIEVELEQNGAPLRLLFSGDLGPGGREFSDDPIGPSGVDHLILESTYGGVERPAYDGDQRRAILANEVKAAHAAGGPLLIPAFAVERTQELLVDLLDIMEKVEAPPGPIFLDSPLAIKATGVFLAHGRQGDGRNPFKDLRKTPWLRYTETANESREIERFRGWHVIVAASGMCDAGRVRHHLKRLLWREQTTVMLVGYQAAGTLGRLLQEGRKEVRIQGEPFVVRAQIRKLDVYSGHADAEGLVRWAKARQPVSGSVMLTHGEPNNVTGLVRRLVAAGFPADHVKPAELDATYALQAFSPPVATAAATPRIAVDAVATLDWHNARAEFLGALDRRLGKATTDAERSALLQRLQTSLLV
jgi:metallo-beta-lactamase family protein